MLRPFAISCLLLALALPAMARTRPHYGGKLRVETEGDPWRIPDGAARRLVLDGLTAFDSSGALVPALAVNWKSENNDHRWQFRLRSGVHFHDGSLLTSSAVVMSLNLSCNAGCPWTEVRDAGSSVIFIGDSPMPNLPALLAGDGFLIALTRAADGQTPSNPIGTGPFQFVSSGGNMLTLAANDNYWGGRPFADKIEIVTGKSIRDQWLDLSVGRADVVEVPSQELRQAQQQHLSVVVSPPVELLALEVSESGALANPVLRASIALAVDRGALFNVIFQKQGQITASLLPQSLTGYSFLFPADRDLNKANELRGGLTAPPLTMTADGDATMQLAAQRIALNLKEAGFNVQLVNARNTPHPDLALRKLPVEGANPSDALAILLQSYGENASIAGRNPGGLFRAEHEFLDLKTLVPLLDLPRAYAIGGRVRDMTLGAGGTPGLAGISLEDTQ